MVPKRRFFKLALHEAITTYLSAISNVDDNVHYDGIDDMTENEFISKIGEATEQNAFRRITAICRVIHTSIKRFHAFTRFFNECQSTFSVPSCIIGDVCTRFDSTLAMFSAILLNRYVLLRIQDIGRRNNSLWSIALHLTLDDFVIIRNGVTILEPVFGDIKALSNSTS